MLSYSMAGTESNGFAISVHSAEDLDVISSFRYRLCLKYLGLLPSSSHSLNDFAVHLSMSTRFASFANVFVSAFFGGSTASVRSIELMTDINFFSRFAALS